MMNCIITSFLKSLSRPPLGAIHQDCQRGAGWNGIQGADIVILDLRLPDMSVWILETSTASGVSHVPLIVITVDNDLNDKLRAFELGADDYLVKPFQPEELVARLRILGQRGKALKIVQQMETQNVDVSTTVAVHSLRGGVGCTSIAVNLAIAYRQLWERHPAGGCRVDRRQVAMMDTAPASPGSILSTSAGFPK
jgi:CheY-like chemotaxis protein